MKDVIEKVEAWVNEHIKKPSTLKHHYKARDYLLEIRPDACVEAQVAALTHDVERSLNGAVLVNPDNIHGKDYLIAHGKNSAKAVLNFLEDSNLDLERLEYLIINHEIGGDEECDALRDADSVSFLEVTAPFFPDKFSKEVCKVKFDYMFNRIGDDKAREIARPFYEEALSLL